MRDPERPLCEFPGCKRQASIAVKGVLLCAKCFLLRHYIV